MRKPFQGVANIIRFNWHFYVLAIGLVLLLQAFVSQRFYPYHIFLWLFCIMVVLSLFVSLVASYYVYDYARLYEFPWIGQLRGNVINIHAGFDETSSLLAARLSTGKLFVFDFYDPEKNTEISIKRARKAYPPYPETRRVDSGRLPLDTNTADDIFVIFAAHEIRNKAQRLAFFKELARVIKPNGKIFITEHLRDPANFLVYNIGAFHFYARTSWLKTFNAAQLDVKEEVKFTPFVSTFVLQKNGNTL